MSAAHFCYGFGFVWMFCPYLSLTLELSEHPAIALGYTHGWFVFSLTLTDYRSFSVQIFPSLTLSFPSLQLTVFQKLAPSNANVSNSSSGWVFVKESRGRSLPAGGRFLAISRRQFGGGSRDAIRCQTQDSEDKGELPNQNSY
uniref:Transient receptor potential cation channel subfamily M member 6 n=1 Tax=Lygus hesperus TaxID=30085 RepID=A0A0A9Z8S2_LYGHE